MIEYLTITALFYAGMGIYLRATEWKNSGVVFSPRTAWIGFQWDKDSGQLFIFLVPLIGIVIKFADA